MIISIDFDGTIVEEAYPLVGKMMPEANIYINKLFSEGHEIIINTCRSGKYEGDAEDFLIKHGIHFNQINSNLPHVIEFYGRDTRKISADLYIDNKQLGGLPLRKGYVCWRSIYHTIKDSIKTKNHD